jgi:hypothetical protein
VERRKSFYSMLSKSECNVFLFTSLSLSLSNILWTKKLKYFFLPEFLKNSDYCLQDISIFVSDTLKKVVALITWKNIFPEFIFLLVDKFFVCNYVLFVDCLRGSKPRVCTNDSPRGTSPQTNQVSISLTFYVRLFVQKFLEKRFWTNILGINFFDARILTQICS